MSKALGLDDDPENDPKQGEKLFDLRLVLGMHPLEQIKRIIVEAERTDLPDIVRALRNYLSQRGRGRPRHDKYAEIDAWLIVWADELFRSGQALSAWAAITRVVEGAWAALDDGTGKSLRVGEVLIGNSILRAPIGKTLSRKDVLGAGTTNSIKHRILTRLRPNKRFPIVIKRNGLTVRIRLHFSPAPGRAGPLLLGGDSIYSHLPIYKALSTRKSLRRKTLPEKEKYR
jgi:hypothetical protein